MHELEDKISEKGIVSFAVFFFFSLEKLCQALTSKNTDFGVWQKKKNQKVLKYWTAHGTSKYSKSQLLVFMQHQCKYKEIWKPNFCYGVTIRRAFQWAKIRKWEQYHLLHILL